MKLLLLCFVALIALACAASPGTISVDGAFSGVTPADDATYKYICYWGFACPAGTSSSASDTAPKCPCSDSALTMKPDFPRQLRWGDPVDTYKSGFGFVGLSDVALPDPVTAPGKLIAISRVAHFNFPIWSGTAAKNWIMTLKFSLNINGVVTNFNWDVQLQLDETSNGCDTITDKSMYGCGPGQQYPNPYWAANPTSMEWPQCVNCSSNYGTRRYSSYGDACNQDKSNRVQCCPYRTTGSACSDKVWTLTEFQKNFKFQINGLDYTIQLVGFADPSQVAAGQEPTPKAFFVSQEGGTTDATMYARLVVACPANCPNGGQPVLSPDGSACVCQCPTNPVCPSGQVKAADCSCVCQEVCPSGACGTTVMNNGQCQCQCASASSQCCPGNQVPQSNQQCRCGCPTNLCGPGERLQNNGLPNAAGQCACECDPTACPSGEVADPTAVGNCQCLCPLNSCDVECQTKYSSTTCVVSDRTNPACPCTCPTDLTCSGNFVLNTTQCACVCPTSYEDSCNNEPGATFNAAQCTCTGNTKCLCTGKSECSYQKCAAGSLSSCETVYRADSTNAKTVPCGDRNLCLRHCGAASDTCVSDVVNCAAMLDAKYTDSGDRSCVSATCDPDTGDCTEQWDDGTLCTPSSGSAGPCEEFVCVPNVGCRLATKPDDSECDYNDAVIPGDPQCYSSDNTATCSKGVCTVTPLPYEPCQDGNTCTVAANVTDNLGNKADQCVPVDGVLHCVGTVNPCTEDWFQQQLESGALTQKQLDVVRRKMEKKNCTVTCVADVTGRYCVNPCLLGGGKSKSDAAAIAGGTVGGVFFFFLIAGILLLAAITIGTVGGAGVMTAHDAAHSGTHTSNVFAGPAGAGNNAEYAG